MPTRAARFENVAGERRWRAAKLAALTDIPVVVRERWVAERNLSVRVTEALVPKTLDGKGRASAAAPPELSVVSEVLRTPDVRVQLQQKSAGSGKLIVEFADTSARETRSSRRSRPRFPPRNALSGRWGSGRSRVHSIDGSTRAETL